MELKLHLDGSVKPFVNYLKNFLRIRESILLEIDTTQRAIVAKTYSGDHTSVRFASISFDEASLSIVSDTNEEDRKGSRIKAGILLQLKKLIQIVERLGSVTTDGKSVFDIIIAYDILQKPDGTIDYIATEIAFKSNILKIKMNGFRVTEFDYLTDEEFQAVFNVMDPVTIDVPGEVIQTVIETSEITKFDPRRDTLVFYVEDGALYVKDKTGESESNFEYKIGDLDVKPDYDIVLPITRERFIKMMDKSDENFRIILGRDPDGVITRILFDSTTSSTKIVIAGMLE